MSQHSSKSAGLDPSSSPFTGTDPTLYSPEIVRDSRSTIRQGRNNVGSATAGASGQQVRRDILGLAENHGVLPQPASIIEGGFTNEVTEDGEDYVTRYLFVSRLPDGTNAGMDCESELYAVQHQMKLYACFANSVPLYNRGIYIRFDDLRESAEGKDILEQHGFTIGYLSGYQFAIARSQDTALVNEFEGQVQLSILIEPIRDRPTFEFGSADLADVTSVIEQICGIFGPIRNCVHVHTNDAKMLLTFRIEFHSADAALRAIHSVSNDATWGRNMDRTYQWLTVNPTHWSGQNAIETPHRAKPRVDDRGRFIGYRPARNTFNDYQNSRHPSDQHNRVRRERILDGSDVRTTIMLRNIPNKLDWMSLKAILDNACFGTYDFVYLRIDFKSGCNVGYAFINFADAQGMISLIDEIERRCWVGFRSDKAAEISYATIQGREALVQKFRNSSVMQETPFCRPRLFFTYVDTEITGKIRSAGTEQAFPRPDNLSKLQRSMDSAHSIGLFPPHGYTYFNDHRNRFSVWDRGTPRDMMQSAMQFAPQHGSAVPTHGLTDDQKRNIENWYSANFGQAHVGSIPFDYIPVTHVSQYLTMDRNMSPAAMPAGFGVIGGPSYAFGHAAPNATPTGGSRDAQVFSPHAHEYTPAFGNAGAYVPREHNPFN